jgi:integrase
MEAKPLGKRVAKRSASFTAKAGSVEVPVYFRESVKGGRTYQEFIVTHYGADGKRVSRSFSDRDAARNEAERIAAGLSRGQSEAVGFSASDADIYRRAVSVVQPFNVPLLAAVSEWAAVRSKLPSGTTLHEAVADYTRRHPANAPRKTVPEVAAEVLADAVTRKLSDEHRRDLKKRLGRFSAAFTGGIASVTPAEFRGWIQGLETDGKPLSNRSRFNYQRTIVSLFHFARRQRYIARELADEIAELDAPKPEATKSEVFTPGEMRQILDAAEADIIPALAIAAFAGLRTAEVSRLTWDAVKLAERVVVVGADRSKTASRRIVPLSDNLVEWLTPHMQTGGRVSPAPNDRAMNHRFARTAARQGIKWRHNALRHSFCSYRLAVSADAARVATEAGNSARMIHQHYRALVTEVEGKAWFDIRPENHTNVIAFEAATG